MKVHQPNNLELPNSVITIGAFDGIHIGHQRLIKETIKKSKETNSQSVVYTFDPPPRVFFEHTKMIMTIEEKLEKLKKMQVDHVIVASFDFSYARQNAKQFVDELSLLNPIEIVAGKDFRFGAKQEGDLDYLKCFFNVNVLPFIYCTKGEKISSSRIRKLLFERNYKEMDSFF